MVRERIVDASAISPEEEAFSWGLRPKSLAELIGKADLVERLRISITAAKQRGEPLEHVLFYGPPGLGKTTLAHIIAHEMESKLVQTSGPALSRTGDLMGILTNLQARDVLLIDEIHRLPPAVEEFIYPAMEDFRVDFVVDRGAFAKTINMPLKPFTLAGSTTRAGLLANPLRERFGLFHHIDFYEAEELREIVRRSAKLLKLTADDEALDEIAKSSRGTPRIANRLLKRVRDYAQVKGDGRMAGPIAREALAKEQLDGRGLDEFDRKFLRMIIEFYNGGPVGIEAIAATLNEESDTLVDMVEPFLLKIGFLNRTSKGRRATSAAYAHLGLEPPGGSQKGLF